VWRRAATYRPTSVLYHIRRAKGETLSKFRIIEPVGDSAAVTGSEIGIGDLVVANVLTQDPRKVYRVADASALEIELDLGATPPDADTVGLVGATFSGSGTWEWREAATQGGLSSPTAILAGIVGRQADRDNPRGEWYNSRAELPGSSRQRWQRITISDAAAGTWQIGRLILGLGLQFSREYQGGWDEDLISLDALATRAGVGAATVAGAAYREVSVSMTSVPPDEWRAYVDLLNRRGETGDVWAFRDFTDDDTVTEGSIYGLLTGVIGRGAGPRQRVTRQYQQRITVAELRP